MLIWLGGSGVLSVDDVGAAVLVDASQSTAAPQPVTRAVPIITSSSQRPTLPPDFLSMRQTLERRHDGKTADCQSLGARARCRRRPHRPIRRPAIHLTSRKD